MFQISLSGVCKEKSCAIESIKPGSRYSELPVMCHLKHLQIHNYWSWLVTIEKLHSPKYIFQVDEKKSLFSGNV